MSNSIYSRAIKNIKRSGWRAYVITFMMTITFLMLGVLLTIMFVSQSIATYFIQQPEVIGFFRDEVSEEEILLVKQDIERFEYVAEVRYVSKEEAMRSFLQANANKQDIIEAVTVNVFPSHLNVRTVSLDYLPEITAYFSNNDLISDVAGSEGFIDTLKQVVFGIQVTAVSLLLVFTVSTIAIMFLAIGISIYSQKQELIIMKLVGATKWFIRAPYVIQSIIYSLVGVLISVLILIPVLLVYYNSFMRFLLGDISFPSLSWEMITIGVLIKVLFALFLAVIASYFATRRYIER